ncbi:hypothetical protein DM860_012711 [Cuscuta australis]|uniref:Uncharacterized protein n=1 Tax=Cuscuta australis TaxID=267555 RepID=A0A328DE88_9ASTE|nr:hypothetical protein DM860_012711 [Cuscuta australis]
MYINIYNRTIDPGKKSNVKMERTGFKLLDLRIKNKTNASATNKNAWMNWNTGNEVNQQPSKSTSSSEPEYRASEFMQSKLDESETPKSRQSRTPEFTKSETLMK